MLCFCFWSIRVAFLDSVRPAIQALALLKMSLPADYTEIIDFLNDQQRSARLACKFLLLTCSWFVNFQVLWHLCQMWKMLMDGSSKHTGIAWSSALSYNLLDCFDLCDLIMLDNCFVACQAVKLSKSLTTCAATTCAAPNQGRIANWDFQPAITSKKVLVGPQHQLW